MVSVTARGLMVQQVLMEMGLTRIALTIGSDSSGARGVCHRQGVGKIRHLELRYLWIQDKIRKKQLTTFKMLGTENPADLGTKYVTKAVLDRLLPKIPIAPSSRWLAEGAATAIVALLVLSEQVDEVETTTILNETATKGIVLAQHEIQKMMMMMTEVLPHVETGFEIARGLFTLLGFLAATIIFFKDYMKVSCMNKNKMKKVDKSIQVSTFCVQQYGLWNVVQLQAECRQRGFIVPGTKPDLVHLLTRDDHMLGPRHTGLLTPPAPYIQQHAAPFQAVQVQAQEAQVFAPPIPVVPVLAPTAKQLSYIRVLASRQGVAIPASIFADRAEATIFIDQLKGQG
jgi:hypothetical protein